MKTCKKCNISKDKAAFYKGKGWRDGLQTQCKSCINSASRLRSKRLYTTDLEFRKSKVAHSEKARLKKQYGISLEQRENMLKNQQYRCAICEKHQDDMGTLNVDHNHDTGKIRDMLCYKCNRAEGFLEGNPDLAIKLANYLIKHGAGDDRDTEKICSIRKTKERN